MIRSEKFEFEATGTVWVIDFETWKENVQTIKKAITWEISRFENLFSRFHKDSFTVSLSARRGPVKLNGTFVKLLTFYHKLYRITEGRFTPLAGDMLDSIGYKGYRIRAVDTNLTPSIDINKVYDFNPPILNLKRQVNFDFGAAGKGMLIDEISALLTKMGVKEYTVDGGGDIYHSSSRKERLRVGLEDPHNPDKVVGVISLGNESVCASSGNRRIFGKVHHIIDAVNPHKTSKVLAVWVRTGTAMLADGISTALFLCKGNKLRRFFNFEYALLSDTRLLEKSPDFNGDFFFGD